MIRNARTILLFTWHLSWSVAAFGAPPDEMTVKAGFLYNFAQFVEWPASKGAFTFCVVGEPEIGHYLQTNLTGKTLAKRRIEVRPEAELQELGGCQVAYLGRSVRKKAPEIAEGLAGRAVLLVSDDPQLGERGVAINFYLDEERVRFEINRRAAARFGIRISSRLMSLARVKD